MGEPQLGGAESEVVDPGFGGGLSTGPGGAPATGAPSAPPATGNYSPETVRAILSGIWTPAQTAAAEVPLAPVTPVEGLPVLLPVERVLPELLSRAAATRTPLTLVLARPGGATATVVAPGAVADLSSALSVSLAPDQHLLRATPGHLAVVLSGGPGAGRRRAERLMQRAGLAGAPMLTWAMASYPSDGSSASALLAVATARLQPAGERAAAGAGRRAALWAGVGAALLAGIFAYTFGSRHGSAGVDSAGGRQSGVAAAGSSSPAGGGSGGQAGSAQTSVPSAWLGGSAGGTSGASASGSGSTAGTGASGSSGLLGGSSQGSSGQLPGGGGGQQGTGTSPTTTLPLNVTTTTSIPVTTTTTAPPSGGTGTTGNTGTTNNQCTGLLQGLICTVNGLLGGGH